MHGEKKEGEGTLIRLHVSHGSFDVINQVITYFLCSNLVYEFSV